MDMATNKSEYQLQRERNILLIRENLGFDYNPNAIVTTRNCNGYEYMDYDNNESTAKKTSVRKRTKDEDESFKGHVSVYSEQRRQSLRIAMKPFTQDYKGFVDEDELSDTDPNEHLDGYANKLSKVVRERKRATSFNADHIVVDNFRVRHFSQTEIDNIAKFAKDKKRSVNSGSSCHQCRQRTQDTKSFCHNARCSGMNGQLCGPCLHGRYGEDVETALKDPKWICPFCRGICNCSFCRRRKGRLPTGILAHVAYKQGYKSVHHLLNLGKINNEYDNRNEDDSGELGEYFETGLHQDSVVNNENCKENINDFFLEVEKRDDNNGKKIELNKMQGSDAVDTKKEGWVNLQNPQVSEISMKAEKNKGLKEYLLGFDTDLNEVMKCF